MERIQLNTLQKAVFLGAGLLAGLALLADPLGISSPGFSWGQFLVAALGGLGMVLVVVLAVWRLSTLQALPLVALLMLMGIEISAGVLTKIISSNPPEETYQTRTQAIYGAADTYYAVQPWANAYLEEVRQSRAFDYHPYVLWRRQPFVGEVINIDHHARRTTPNADCSPHAYTVYLFGGSTLWGTGTPDWGTIAAHLQTALAAHHTQPVCVVNFGESAYVSDQNIIALVLELKAGRVPDVVLFYDGINEMLAAYQNGQAGLHQNMRQFNGLFKSQNTGGIRAIVVDWFQQTTYSARLLDRWFGTFRNRQEPEVTYQTLGAELEPLADAVMANYRENYVFVEQLAAVYGFEFAFFWEPIIIMSNKELTSYEQALQASEPAALRALTEAIYTRAQHTAPQLPRLYSLVHVLDEQSAQMWVDPRHLTPEANQIVAGAMLAVINQD